jgi:hypothetical protein
MVINSVVDWKFLFRVDKDRDALPLPVGERVGVRGAGCIK